jgi:glucokinase
MRDVTIGIDIGGTNTKFGVVDKDGNVLFHSSIPTQEKEYFHDYIKGLCQEIQKGIDALEEKVQVLGMGIGAPNANYYKGTIEEAPNLKWKGILPLAKLMREAFGVPVIVTNDANAAAVGEMVYGGAKHMKDFVVVTLGTGLGGGIVCNGELVNGHTGFAGELGHMTVNYTNGRHCGCGKRGCLETYVSATGIRRTVYKLLADHMEASEMRKISFEALNTEMITEAALRGDIIAREAFEYTGRILGTKLAETVVHTNPEAIFLFGGLSQAGDLIFEPTRHHLEKHLMPIYQGKVKLLKSQLQNQSAPILGASSLAWKYLEKEMEKA